MAAERQGVRPLQQMAKIAPAYRIYVDESGTPAFRLQRKRRVAGYVASAVVVGELERESVEATLPRGRDSKALKFTDHELTVDAITECFRRLFQFDVHASVVLLQLDSARNIGLAEELTQFANQRRKQLHNPKVKQSALFYMYCTNWAVIRAWDIASTRLGSSLSYFDLIYDEACVTKHGKGLVRDSWQDSFKKLDAMCHNIIWANEQDEPLLNLPDLIAGVWLRQAERGDVTRAWEVLDTAERRGWLYVQDGFDTIDPSAGAR